MRQYRLRETGTQAEVPDQVIDFKGNHLLDQPGRTARRYKGWKLLGLQTREHRRHKLEIMAEVSLTLNRDFRLAAFEGPTGGGLHNVDCVENVW